MNSLTVSLVAFVAFIISLSTHEYCHALASFLLGDETAKRMGRLTLNPLAHLDPIGTVLIPLIGALFHIPIIGWAKPVPFNPYNLRYQKWGATIVALSGPLANFLGAFVYVLLLKFSLQTLHLQPFNLLPIFLTMLVAVNVVLGLFNFIPVPPLDGSKLLAALLTSPKYRQTMLFLETRGPIILLVLIILDSFSPISVLGTIFGAALNFVFSAAGVQGMLGIF